MSAWILAIAATIAAGAVGYGFVYLGCCGFVKDTTP